MFRHVFRSPLTSLQFIPSSHFFLQIPIHFFFFSKSWFLSRNSKMCTPGCLGNRRRPHEWVDEQKTRRASLQESRGKRGKSDFIFLNGGRGVIEKCVREMKKRKVSWILWWADFINERKKRGGGRFGSQTKEKKNLSSGGWCFKANMDMEVWNIYPKNVFLCKKNMLSKE